MKRNKIRIVCNPNKKEMSFFLKNELGEWESLSNSSPLSRKKYTCASMEKNVKEILTEIDVIYNRKNKGVEILFEGTDEKYDILSGAIKKFFYERDILSQIQITKTAVVGKLAVGKTCLIKGFEALQEHKYAISKGSGYVRYLDKHNHVEWYEVNGIDFGKDKIEETFEMISRLSEEDLSTVIYCVSAEAGRIEEIEQNFIKKIAEIANIKVMIVLTMCYIDEQDIRKKVDNIEKITDQIKIVPVLSKPYKTGAKNQSGEAITIDAFGLEDISKFVFEGR